MNRFVCLFVCLILLALVWTIGSFTFSHPCETEPDNPARSVSVPSPKSAVRARKLAAPVVKDNVAEVDLLALADAAPTDPDHGSAVVEHMAESIPDGQLAKMLNALMTMERPAAADLRRLLVARWTAKAPLAAANWAAQLPEGPAATEALTQVSVTWANADLAGAVAWAQSLPDTKAKTGAILDIAYEAARVEPLTSLEMAVTLPASPERDRLLSYGASQWAIEDPARAIAWAQAIPELELQQPVLAAALIALSSDDGASAASLAAQILRPGAEQDRAVVAIVQRWAQSSPRETADWISQFPDAPLGRIAAENLVLLWTAQDPAAPGQWLEALPENSLRTAGWSAYAQALRQYAPGDMPPPSSLSTGAAHRHSSETKSPEFNQGS